MHRTALLAWLCCFLLLGANLGLAQDDAGESTAGDGGTAGEETPPDGEGGDGEDGGDLTGTTPVNVDPPPALPVQRNELNRNQLGEDLSLPPGGARLGQGLRLRPWLVFQPSFRSSVFYDDNVFRQGFSDRDEDVEIINTLTGRLAATRERWNASISYSAIFRNFVDNSTLDSVDHLVQATAGLDFNRVTFAASASAAWVKRPTDPQFGGQNQRRFTLQGNLRSTITITQRIGVQLEAQTQRIESLTRTFEFFDQHGYGGTAFLTFNPNLPITFLAGGGYRELLYTDSSATNPDIGLYSVLAGFGLATADSSLTFDFRGGYEFGDVLRRRTFAPGRDAPEGVVLSAAGGWAPNQLTNFTLTLTRQITFSAQASSLTLSRVDVAANRTLPFNTAAFVRFGWGLQDNRDGPSRRTLDATLGVTWDPLPWLSFGLQTSYLNSKSRLFDFGVYRAGGSVTVRL